MGTCDKIINVSVMCAHCTTITRSHYKTIAMTMTRTMLFDGTKTANTNGVDVRHGGENAEFETTQLHKSEVLDYTDVGAHPCAKRTE